MNKISKIGLVAEKFQTVERCLSGLLRIQKISQDPAKYTNKVDSIGGWVKNIRLAQKSTIIFIDINDGSSQKHLQVVVENSMPNFEQIAKQKISACLQIKGKLVPSPKNKEILEMQVNDPENHSVQILGENTDPKNYILKKRVNFETLRNYLHLRPKSNYIQCMTRIRNALAMATHMFYQKLGFMYIHTPIITGSDCEGAGEMFTVTTMVKDEVEELPLTQDKKRLEWKQDFFKKKVSLTVSGQLAVENYAHGLNNVYTFGPTFRAEKANTRWHLNEF